VAVLVGSNCCSVRGSCTSASPADAVAGSVLCSCIGCRSATGTVSSWNQAIRGREWLSALENRTVETLLLSFFNIGRKSVQVCYITSRCKIWSI